MKSLLDSFAERRYPEAFRKARELLRLDPGMATRVLRDLWLRGEAPGLELLDPSDPFTDFFLSSLAWKGGRDLEALGLLHRASLRQGQIWMRYYIAEILLRRLDLFRLALREASALLRQVPWLWETRCLRAEILWTLGAADPLEGLRDLRVPEASRAPFLAWRGALGLWSGRYQEALPDLDQAVSLGNPDAYCWRGGARAALGSLEPALEDLNQVLARDSQDPEALTWRAETNRRLGRPQESLRDLDALLASSEETVWALVNRALIRLEQEDYGSAARDFARLAPRFYVPGGPGGADPAPDSWTITLKLSRLKGLLEQALRLARGCRRSDIHLNLAWMRAAGIAVPAKPSPGCRLLYWLGAAGLRTPPELRHQADALDERDVKRLFESAKPGSSLRAASRSRRASSFNPRARAARARQ